MSQNQSYFWQTTRHNVYLKRTAKLHLLLAMMAVLTFSTICLGEMAPTMGIPRPLDISVDEKHNGKDDLFNAGKEIPNNIDDAAATKETLLKPGFLDAFSASISVILFTELGDKTFFIAAIMAMRHPRLIVFAGAITALALMTVLSVVFGMAATIIPKIYTYYISTALFAIFGLKMIYEGYFMKDSDTQEEFEEVASSLRKRDDELLRGKYDDVDGKRKNSNSDKEDNNTGTECSAGTADDMLPDTEMQHRRQRKPLNYNNIIHNNNNGNGCETPNGNNDDHVFDDGHNERIVFRDGSEHMKMSTTFHSSPALSSSALSNKTQQTNCDDFKSSSNRINFKASNGDISSNTPTHKTHRPVSNAVMVHSASAAATLMHKGNNVASTNDSITSLSSISINSTGAAGQPNGELKQLGGNKKRMERDVSATLVQDPESGVVRKAAKKSASYITTRVLMQAFTMTFLAEWGDRSQLTTIILAASKNVYGVIAGGVIGHSLCTGLAVICGRMVAAKISVRTVTILGGIVFVGFAIYALIWKPDDI